jgi:hypothetical protein
LEVPIGFISLIAHLNERMSQVEVLALGQWIRTKSS